jgi:hypothetical protein
MPDLTNITSKLLIDFTPSEAITLMKPLAVFVLMMVIYSVFVFKFYRFIARRDIFSLDLRDYNKTGNQLFHNSLNVILYFIQYLLLFPIFTFFWLAVLAFLLSFLAREQTIQNVLLVSVSVVASVRIAAYYNEDLSHDLAKMLPFALLGVFLLNISFFSWADVMTVFGQLQGLLKLIVYYLIFVISLEFVLRVMYFIKTTVSPKDESK